MDKRSTIFAGLAAALMAAPAQAQLTLYLDDQSDSACDLVNASNTELAVLADTQELVIVTGQDVILVNTFVDDTGAVFVNGALSGLVEFAEDGEGFRTLWWIGLTGTVVEVDALAAAASDSGLFPSDFVNVPCDACVLWDDPFECGGVILDSDGDGVTEPFDLCGDTALGSLVDDDGCACYELDDDFDGVDNCDDLCPETPLDAFVDFDGCVCFQLDDDLDGVNNCDDLCELTPLDVPVDNEGCEIVAIVDGGSGGGTNVTSLSLMCGSFGTLSLLLMFAGLATCRARRWGF